jgi:ABC-type branched-subunit amino acid transport system ATPase component/predicted MFS family arabinose efflux permease
VTTERLPASSPQDPPPGVEGEKKPIFQRLDPRNITRPAPLFPLFVLFGLNAVEQLDRVAFALLGPEIRNWFGLSLAGLFTLTAITAPASLALELPVAYMADRRNRVRMSAIGATIWAFFSFATGMAWNVLTLALARMGSAIGSLFTTTHRALLSDYYEPVVRVKAFYAYQVSASVGQFLGPLLVGLMSFWLIWRWPFLLFALPTLFFVVLTLKLREPARGAFERLAAGADEETSTIEDDPPNFTEVFRTLFALPSARRIYYSLPFFFVSLFGFGTILSPFYAEVYGLNVAWRSLIFSSTEPAQVVGLLIGAIYLQRVVIDKPVLAARLVSLFGVASAFGIFVMAVSPNLAVAIAGNLFNSLVGIMLVPGIYALASFIVPPRMRALGFATANVWFLMGVPILPFVGTIADTWGIRTGLILVSITYMIGMLILGTAGRFFVQDMEKVRVASRAQAEATKARNEGLDKLLVVRGLDVGYDGVQVLFGVDFEVADGEIVALLGTNGAGKSTLLKAITGVVDSQAGAVLFDGRLITTSLPQETAKFGISHVPGGRGIFPTLTVAENIQVAQWLFRGESDYLKKATEEVLDHFPILRDRWNQQAGSLSGGEQQMLSLAQAFISRPKLLLIDELTLGLAPTIVERLLEIVRRIHANGTTIVLVEQSVNVALRLAQRAVFLEKGEVRFEGPTQELLDRPDVLRSVFLKGAASVDGKTSGDGARTKRTAAGAKRQRTERSRDLLQAPVVLQTVGLTKSYGGVAAVQDVDLELHEGEVLGIIGPNGAGKTSLFDLITGFTVPDRGRVILHGEDVSGRTAAQRATAGLGRSFQDARLWPALTVEENLQIAFERAVLEKSTLQALFRFPLARLSEGTVARQAVELIELLGLESFRDKFVRELSTGSRRIVEVAAMLAHRPSVLLLDEPSSGIAQKETEALGPLLLKIREHMNASLVVIEHDMPLISSIADRILALDLGQYVTDGPPDEVLNHHTVIESYLGTSGYSDILGSGRKRKAAPGRRKTSSRRKPAAGKGKPRAGSRRR